MDQSLDQPVRQLLAEPLPSMVDVLILGAGPAGLATAIFLAQTGYQVLLATRKLATVAKIGESLTPIAQKLLQQLGIWEQFLTDGHLPCYAHKSVWGSNRLEYHDFIQNPWGTAWHLDRIKFEQRLLWQAQRLGVQCVTGARLINATQQSDFRAKDSHSRSNSQANYWHVQWPPPTPPLRARFIVDATGRSSYFAHSQGVTRHYQDRQVALATFLTPTTAPLTDFTTLVEAIAQGWWYSAVVPNGQLATMFTTDLDLHHRRLFCQRENWTTLLANTHYTTARVRENHYNLLSRPQLVAVESSQLAQLAGEGWLAVGDAALTYDPLAAHGLTMALTSARDAAAAIAAYFAGQPTALLHYHNQLQGAFAHYQTTRQRLYVAEHRWPHALYWQRRR